ncbi:leucine-rich repeat domain, L domain-like protein [Artemisia annua]|uniref:Leucine-rich repeat domain, L domain-like protein n=1 Tax=Artemisia annua TaxID=35608 RepID=A0A2U1NPC8_ARTAN|nr:leucine-rich repeat domain, L domain-like protein [Artemisia annua]
MKYAVRTSSLSHKWEHVWTALPHLNFNCSAFRSKSIFSEFVNDTLSHRNNDIKLTGIELTFKGAATASSVIKKSVNYAYMHNVTKLSVKWVTKKYIQFPQELFSSHTLKHFTLATNVQSYLLCKTSCVPKLAWDFPVLETLILKNIRLGDEGDESLDLFSKCVNLKDLTLHQCCMKGLNILNIYASQLSDLTITQSLSLPNVFDVIAPQLKNVTASVKGTIDRFPVSFDTLRLATEGFDHLAEVNLSLLKPHYNRERFVPVLLDLFQTFRNAKTLIIDTAIIETLSLSPNRLSERSPFNELNSLRINMAPLNQKEYIASMLTQVISNYLLENSPDVTFIMDLPQDQLKRSRDRVDMETMANKVPKLKAEKDNKHLMPKGRCPHPEAMPT